MLTAVTTPSETFEPVVEGYDLSQAMRPNRSRRCLPRRPYVALNTARAEIPFDTAAGGSGVATASRQGLIRTRLIRRPAIGTKECSVHQNGDEHQDRPATPLREG